MNKKLLAVVSERRKEKLYSFHCFFKVMTLTVALTNILTIFPASGQTYANNISSGWRTAAGIDPNIHLQQKEDKEIPLEEVLSNLQDRYHVNFGFSPKVVKNKYVTLRSITETSDENLDKILHRVLDPLMLKFEKLSKDNYVIYEGYLKIKRSATESSNPLQSLYQAAEPQAQNIIVPHTLSSVRNSHVAPVITGKVTGQDDGSPLPGANVIVKGTSLGTVTDSEGKYSIDASSEDAVLVFSSIGYGSQEIPVNGRTVIDVVMALDIQQLSEVVVVGYGTQKKADVTGAIATFNTDQIKERPLLKVDQALIGQMAGVRVKQTSGIPGRGFSIQVRGTGSISANTEPLYVVDGFPLEPSGLATTGGGADGSFARGNPLDNINPNDIESIQVLKDAASAAIYGSRASNGVVIIKTKSGQSGKARITLNAYTGINQTIKKLDVMNGDEWVDRAIETINYNWVRSGPGRTADQTTDQRKTILNRTTIDPNLMLDDRWLEPGHPELLYVDWQDLMFRTGVVQNYEVSATGGTDAANYFISGGYLDQEGIAIGVGYKRFTARANVEIKANEKLKFGLNVSPSYSITNDPGVEGKDNQMHIAASMTPVVEESVGWYETNVGPNKQYTWGPTRSSPIATIDKSIGDTKIFRTLNTAFAEYQIIKSLAFRTSVNFDNQEGNIKVWIPGEVQSSRATTGYLTGFRRQNFANENTLTYNTTFDSKHNLNLLAGMSYNSFRFDNWRMNGSTFTSDEITTLNAASLINGFSTESKNILFSYFGRLQYSFNDRYLVTASIRRDGSSKFGAATKWGTFPSASVGWRISEENFMDGISNVVSDLKLRGSWGIAGNNGIPDYGSIALLQFSNYSFGGTLVKGQSPQNFPNEQLSWETSETIDVGLDFGLFQNRISASVDYYTKDNTDLLLRIPVPLASGFRDALTNIGRVLNKGVEIELHTRNLTGALQWSTDLNFSHNVNEVKKLGPNDTPILDAGGADIEHRRLKVGEPMWSIWVVRQIGVLSPEDIAAGYPMYNTQEAGDPKYLDAGGPNGVPDGKIDANDRVIVGNPNPKYTWGMSNTVKFKGFDLNVLVQGQYGGHLYSMFGRAMDRTGMGVSDNTLGKYTDRWRSPDDPGSSGLHKLPSTFGRIKNTDWLYSSDYWRVRNITLGYNLGSLLKSTVISGARVYVTAENWFGHDKYDGGFNPEGVNNNGEDYGAFPLSKSLIFGVNLTF
jgi:TonB-linked SusC/RagA family outer membrane protein